MLNINIYGEENMALKGKVAIVTGGGTGIGAAITQRFIAEGAKVCITGRRKEKLEQEAAAFPQDSLITCPGDVSKQEDVKKMVTATLTFGGKIDILVNNAGTDAPIPVTELPLEEWRRVLDTNLTGPFLLMKETIPYMIKNGGGSIINISSAGALRCMPTAPAYASSKGGLILLTQQAALDYGPSNIRCNVICPAATKTTMLDEAVSQIAKNMGTDLNGIFARFSAHIPLRRLAEPREIASACYFLASDDSSFISGTVLVVDGGANVVDISGASIS
jgi:meso-butanediol dehydrogenase/(S,S)-butanediol dehydrogenase/diacetyl reductase